MAVTDLTGTKWLLNENPQDYWGVPYKISFISNHVNFVALFADPDDLYDDGRGLKYFVTTPSISPYNFEYVYNSRSKIWTNQAYRLIEITGGTDATNAALISWIQANAEQVIDPSKLLKSGTSVIGKINGHYVSSVNGTSVMSGIVADTPPLD